MTAYRFVTLTCDGCGEIFDEGTKTTFREARQAAARYGWWTTGGGLSHQPVQDWCPKHRKDLSQQNGGA